MKKLINHSQHKILKVLTSMMLALLLPHTVFSNEQNSTNAQPSEQLSPLILWYTKPADQWVEALPIGNGRFGGMVFGRIDYERIQLNEESMWSGSRTVTNKPDAYKYLPEVRRLLFEGKYTEAQKITERDMMTEGT